MLRNKNGIRLLTNPKMNEGRITGKCPPLLKTTNTPVQGKHGDVLGKYRNIWPPVKWVSTLG